MKKQKIKIGIIGVGNCASSLIQGVEYYKSHKVPEGLITPTIGSYTIGDIEVVCAFDVDKRKVGKDIAEAIHAKPNCTKQFAHVKKTGVKVCKGKVLDGVSKSMTDSFVVDSKQKVDDVVRIIKESGAEMVIAYLPVGSRRAARFYAQCALDAGVAFINAIPEFICSDEAWIAKFKKRGLICAGDDIKSQVGATILHRVITRLIQDRGHTIVDTYQLNVGGNTDFKNMLDHSRLSSKRISKTRAVVANLDNGESIQTRIGPSDFIPHLQDNKICYINVRGTQFGGIAFELDLKLSVEDSPNSAGVMADVIRYVKRGIDAGLSGNLEEVCAYYFKSPKRQIRDDVARELLEKYHA